MVAMNDAPKSDVQVSCVECRTCGFEPADQDEVPAGACPKCHSTSWERFVRPSGIRNVGPRWRLETFHTSAPRVFRCALSAR